MASHLREGSGIGDVDLTVGDVLRFSCSGVRTYSKILRIDEGGVVTTQVVLQDGTVHPQAHRTGITSLDELKHPLGYSVRIYRPVHRANKQSKDGLSIVLTTHNRNGPRLRNLLASLAWQSILPREVIVVDTSSGSFSVGITDTLSQFSFCKHIHHETPIFNKSLALNIGIRATATGSRFVMCTDADMLFGREVIKTVLDESVPGDVLVLSETAYLPHEVDTDAFGYDWEALCRSATPGGRKLSPGAIQVATRNWWFHVHGYDESFAGGLGGMDDDLWLRAKNDGLTLKWLSLDESHYETWILHQWHSRSPLKGVTSHVFEHEPRVVKNEKGWGRWPSS